MSSFAPDNKLSRNLIAQVNAWLRSYEGMAALLAPDLVQEEFGTACIVAAFHAQEDAQIAAQLFLQRTGYEVPENYLEAVGDICLLAAHSSDDRKSVGRAALARFTMIPYAPPD